MMMGPKPRAVAYTVDARGCHLCTSHSHRGGRPQIGRHIAGRHRNFTLPKWLWEQAHGPVPAGRKIFHTCGNVGCIRLDHLVPLTPAEIQDRIKRVGEDSPAAKLTTEQARRIREASGRGALQALAAEFGVTWTCVRQVRSGRTWKHLGPPVQPPRDYRPAILRGRALRALREAHGLTAVEVARRTGIDFTAISRLENERAPFTRDTEERYLAALSGTQ